MRAVVLSCMVAVVAATNSFYRLPTPFSYDCVDSHCIKKERGEVSQVQSLSTCQLTCGKYGALWPQPTGDVELSQETIRFSPLNMEVTKLAAPGAKVPAMLQEAATFFMRNVHYMHPDYPEKEKRPLTQQPQHFEEQVDQHAQRIQLQQIRFSSFEQQQQQVQQQQQQQKRQQQFSEVQSDMERFLRYSPFLSERSNARAERQNVDVEITVTSADDKLSLDTDESYNLVVQTVDDQTTVTILATTYYGARHALETLTQLIAFEDDTNSLQMVKNARVHDKPQFKYRGVMLDTGRNFYPKEDLMRMLDAMSHNKLNYFHWHITDSASFPMYSNRRPEMAYYGAYSPRKIYYAEDITDVVQYAKLRGIVVVPEIDGPAHSYAGWTWGEKEGKGKLALCTGSEGQPWFSVGKEPPSGQLNPVNPELYPVLGDIYADMIDYFDPEMVHMGGDGVSFKCWQNSPEITEYLSANNREASSKEMFELWNTYQNNAYAKLTEAAQGRAVKPIIHSSSFALNYMDKNAYIIQLNEFADAPEIAEYVNNGFKVIFSNQDQWRLDCSGSSWIGEKSDLCATAGEVPSWEAFYNNSPLDMLATLGVSNARSGQVAGAADIHDQVLGGEASLWSSDTDANSFQAKAWPRVSAMAERLWTDPIQDHQTVDTTQKRLNTHRQRMVNFGIRADPITPEYCMQDESACFSQEQYQARTAAATPAQ